MKTKTTKKTTAKKAAPKTTAKSATQETSDAGVRALQKALGREPTGKLTAADGAQLTKVINGLEIPRKQIAEALGFRHFFSGAEKPAPFYAKGRNPISQNQAELLAEWLTEHSAPAKPKRSHKATPKVEAPAAPPEEPVAEAEESASVSGEAQEPAVEASAEEPGLTGAGTTGPAGTC